MKLISMTNFVLNLSGKIYDYGRNYYYSEVLDLTSEIINYAKILKQPFKLWMFVPCDDNGNYWKFPPTKEEWEWAKNDSTEAEMSFKQKEYHYNKAKERVLFKGVKYSDESCVYSFETDKIINEHVLEILNSIGVKTIEDLIKYDLELEEGSFEKFLYK